MTNSFEACSLPLQTLPSLCHNDVLHLQLPDLLFRFQQVSAASHVFTLDFQGQIMTGILILRSIQALIFFYHSCHLKIVSQFTPVLLLSFISLCSLMLLPSSFGSSCDAFMRLNWVENQHSVSKSVSSLQFFFMPHLFSVTLIHDFVMASPLFVDRQKLDHRKRTHQHLIVGKTCYT